MKRIVQWCLVVACVATLGWAATEKMSTKVDPKMDPITVGAGMYKLDFENERVRVMEVSFQPGQKIGKHSHPEHFVYVLSGGQLTISRPTGAPSVADLTPGQVLWLPAETHWAENTGTTPVKLLVTELKEPAMSSKKG